MEEEEDARVKIVVCKMDFSSGASGVLRGGEGKEKTLLLRSSTAGGASYTFIFIHNAQLCVLFFVQKMFGLIQTHLSKR